MSLISFLQEAGEKLFNHPKAAPAAAQRRGRPTSTR